MICADHPVTGRKWYFVDKCPPFGHAISCALFQRFSDALAHVSMFQIRKNHEKMALTNYLDDFLFMALTTAICQFMMEQFLQICELIGVPILQEKSEWPATVMIFLEMLLHGERFVIAVPEDKKM